MHSWAQDVTISTRFFWTQVSSLCVFLDIKRLPHRHLRTTSMPHTVRQSRPWRNSSYCFSKRGACLAHARYYRTGLHMYARAHLHVVSTPNSAGSAASQRGASVCWHNMWTCVGWLICGVLRSFLAWHIIGSTSHTKFATWLCGGNGVWPVWGASGGAVSVLPHHSTGCCVCSQEHEVAVYWTLFGVRECLFGPDF